MLLALASLLTAIPCHAAIGDVEIDCVFYRPDTTDNTASMIGANVENVVIKPSITIDSKTYTVDKVKSAINYDDKLYICKSIFFPSSIQKIDPFIFSNTPKLSSIDCESPEYKVVDGILYTKDMTTALCVPRDASSVNLPETLEQLEFYAFQNCKYIQKLKLPNKLKISSNRFLGCSSLTEFIIDDTNTNLSVLDGVLYDKKYKSLLAVPAALDNVDIPSTVTRIESYAFYGCTKNTKHKSI